MPCELLDSVAFVAQEGDTAQVIADIDRALSLIAPRSESSSEDESDEVVDGDMDLT